MPITNRNHKMLAILLAVSVTFVGFACIYVPMLQDSRAILVSPRFGAPVRTAPSLGSSGTGGIIYTIRVVVAVEPTEARIPAGWLTAENWEIGLSTSYLNNATIQTLTVKVITVVACPFTSTGARDSSMSARNAVEIEVNIPDTLMPGLYNLHMGYKFGIAGQSIKVTAGAYIGAKGSAGNADTAFILSETNCVYIPSVYDGTVTDALSAAMIPFSLIHISDIHVALDGTSDRPVNYYKLHSLLQAISIFAPDIIVGSGDFTNAPADFPEEYQKFYDLFRAVGVPLFASNGNHDHGNIGLFTYYFGPLYQSLGWGGTRLISFDSVIPPTGETLQWMVSNLKNAEMNNEKAFLVDHYPIMDIMDREAASSVGTLLNAMLQYNAAGTLNGHNHYFIIYDMAKAYQTYNNMGSLQEACDIPESVGSIAPEITGPKIFLTTSAAKEARLTLAEEGIWDDFKAFLGFRRITMGNGKIINYTYDFDEDGQRDPSYGYPTEFARYGGVNWSLAYNPGNLMVGAQYSIINNLTESIPWARAAIILPKVAGYVWQSSTPGILVRTRFANATHEFLDIRICAPGKIAGIPTITTIDLLPQLL